MAALITSTVGISVQQIYCYCVGKTTFAIFDEAQDACAVDTRADADSCCKIDPPACCTREAVSLASQHGCTEKTVRVFQLKTEFLVSHPLDKSLTCPLWAGELPEFLRLCPAAVCLAAPVNKAPPEPPPPPSGRQICLRHEVIRC